MKKFRAVLGTALVFLVSILCLVACGKEEVYKFESMEVTLGSVTTSVKVGESYMGQTYDADSMTLTLKSGGKAVFQSGGQEKECNWKETDGKIEVSADGETLSFTKDGDKLILTQEYSGNTSSMTMKTVLSK